MARASLRLRKPGQGVVNIAPADIEAFVDGTPAPATALEDNAASESAPTEPAARAPALEPISSPPPPRSDDIPTFRRANKSLARRKTKPDRRRTTVYMDLQIARRVAHVCAEQDRDMSDIVNDALSSWLASRADG